MVNSQLLRPGTVVETSFGVGVVIAKSTNNDEGSEESPSGAVKVQLWRLPGRSIGTATTAFLQPSAILRELPVAPGMTTTTKDEDVSKKVLVHSYIKSTDSYLVSYADEEDAAAVAAILPQLAALSLNDDDSDDDDFFDAEEENGDDDGDDDDIAAKLKEPLVLLSYKRDQLNPAHGAKFYPLLLELMARGDQAAAQVGGLWEQNKDKINKVKGALVETSKDVSTKVKGQAQNLIEHNNLREKDRPQQMIENTADAAENAADKAVSNLKTQVEENAPSQEQVQKVMTMLKDEELTVLLENGKERLSQLVSADIPQATQTALSSMGIQWKQVTTQKDKALEETHQKALLAVDDLLQSVQKAALAQGIDIPADKLSLKGLNLKELESQFQELHLEEKFQVMFDNFVEASKGDRHLSGIMDHVSKHTTEWQQMTGRLMATKSGSLFLEGASRIQARAGLILNGGKASSNNLDLNQWTQSMTTKFTKAFTEGDAAAARLKSIELGDAVRQRLVSAIEIRSDSLGGLDGIIARALGAVESRTKKTAKSLKKRIGQHNISDMLDKLQTSATGKKKEAHETLISVLSSKSIYRDLALLKLERTFCDLEVQFFGASWNSEDAWSAEDLAKLARGEGGTSGLFEPIAKRAKLEIDKQLDAAEANIQKQNDARGGQDKNADMALEALRRVRKMMSGELTMDAIVGDVVNMLNDDKIVTAGESLIQRGESILDAIEGASSMQGNMNDPTNRMITDAMKVAKKAGITKDSVMAELEKINVDEVIDTAQGAVTDENKRRQLLSQATDAALDFFLKVLPNMPVPPFEGVKDGLVYHLSDLSMEGFKVKKENIVVEIAGMRATSDKGGKKSSKGALGMKAMKAAVKDISPEATAGTALAAPESGSSVVDDDSESDDDSFANPADLEISTTEAIGNVKATELLIIDISDVAAVLDGATWNFEQTYFPYLKGNGKSDVKLTEGAVRLQFELRKRKRKIQTPKTGAEATAIEGEQETEEKEIWEPVLCLHDRSCKIGEVFVSLQGEGRMAWILNKLADYFKGPVGAYVARQIVAVMSNKSGVILDKLNTVLSPYWDMIMSTAGLKMDDLVEADHRVVTTADSEDNENTIELVWRERLPLGLNLLLNDESGQVKVVDLPRGSQARKVCEGRTLDPDIFKGATIVAVNGCRFFEPEEVYDALRDPIRPKTVLFELAEAADAARVKEFVADAMDEKDRKMREAAGGGSPIKTASSEDSVTAVQRKFKTRTFELTEAGDLGIEFGESTDNFGLTVCGFAKKDDRSLHAAEESGSIHVNDLLTHINGKLVVGVNGAGREKAFELLQAEGSQRPLSLGFSDPYLRTQIFEAPPKDITANLGGPAELCFEETRTGNEHNKTKRIVLTDYKDTDGVAESLGIFIGDYLVFVNGKSVGAGSRWLAEGEPPSLEEVYALLRDPAAYPMGLTFARPKKGGDLSKSWSNFNNKKEAHQFEDDEAETVAVAIERLELLGCVFDVAEGSAADVIVTDFYAVPGFFQSTLMPVTGPAGNRMIRLAVESINGEFVPSYASKDMVSNAMKRSWSKERRVEVLFCDDELKAWVHGMVTPPPPPPAVETMTATGDAK